MNKSMLQELCQRHSWPLPEYTTMRQGPSHDSRFSCTVTVKGESFESPPFEFRSSKEAQNYAAKLAYEYFVPAPGFSTSEANLNITPLFMPAKQENGENCQASQTSSNHECDTMSKAYKNRLQNYAQKRNLPFPVYSYEVSGPAHARRFKSRVTIGGDTYESPGIFSNLKDAEHAAAKVAFESRPPDDVQEDESLYKSLLQELAQKRGFLFPVYNTANSGPPHQPCFVATVGIGNEQFQGQKAKTKKQAEMSAAKVAYIELTRRNAKNSGTVVSTSSPGCRTMGDIVVSSSDSDSVESNKTQPNITSSTNEMELHIKAKDEQGLATKKDAAVGSNMAGASPASSDSLPTIVTELQSQELPVVTDKVQLHVRPIDNLLVHEEQAEKNNGPDIIAKRYKVSSPDGHPLLSAGAYSKSALESKITGPARRKIVVLPNKPGETYPDGPVVARDEKWVAVRVGIDQNQ